MTNFANRIYSHNTIGVVPKWFKGTVCKTVIHQFESGRRLHIHIATALQPTRVFAVVFLFLLAACGDGRKPAASPSPKDLPRWSSTEYVEWNGPNDRASQPIALIIDRTDGPLDQMCGDVDVTSFLNDRFHPIFIHSRVMPSIDSALILISPNGETLGGPLAPHNASALIQLGNQLMRKERLPIKPWPCDNLKQFFEETHPVLKACVTTK